MLTRLSSDLPRKLSCLAASYAQLGRDAEARATATEIRDMMEPGLAAMLGEDRDKWRDHWLKMFSIFRSEDFEHLLEGLRKAGLPAWSPTDRRFLASTTPLQFLWRTFGPSEFKSRLWAATSTGQRNT